MPVEWSGSGPEVLIILDRGRVTPLRIQLEDQVREAIRSGRLSSGEQVPSSRVLARLLGLSRGLVQDAYAQLQAEGYLIARAGSATRVARAAVDLGPAMPTAAPSPAPPLVADFQCGVPDLGSVPRADWAWAMREACRSAPNTALGYHEPQGYPQLREVLAAYLGRVRAMDVHADQVAICSGVQQGLGLVLRALAARGADRVAFEDPGPVSSLPAIARWAGLAAVPVPVDDLGIDTAALDASRANAVLVTPAHQWPTGVVLASRRRLELVDWATRHGAFIIEDDYDAEFRYDREPVGSMQGLAPDRVIALGTVSKSIAPAIRLGWIASPLDLVSELAQAKGLTDRGSPGLDQLALAVLLESGRYDRHLRRMRAKYAAKRNELIGALTRHAPAVRLSGLAAGFHAVAHLPAGTEEQAVIRAARSRSVGLYGMSGYRAGHRLEPPQLVLGFGNTSREAIQAGIAVLGDILGP